MLSAELLACHPVMTELRKACGCLRLPLGTPLELLRFLALQRALPAAAGTVSPSESMDQLQHWVLLNTHVRNQVQELIGGEIVHSTASASHPDELKVQRQLRMMGRMEQAGWRDCPNLEVWQQQGTLMEAVVRVPVRVLDDPAAAVGAFVCPGLTQPRDVREDLKARGYAYVEVSEREGSWSIVCRSHSQTTGRSQTTCRSSKQITLLVKTLTGKSFQLRLHLHNTVLDMKECIEEREGIPPDQQRLIFAGRQLEDLRTMADYGLDDGCTLHLILRLRG